MFFYSVIIKGAPGATYLEIADTRLLIMKKKILLIVSLCCLLQNPGTAATLPSVDENGNFLPQAFGPGEDKPLNLPADTRLGGNSIQSSFDSKGRAFMTHVKDKGAIGNGIADDTAAFQRAIDETADGGTIVCDGGDIFKITSSLLIQNRSMLTITSPSTAIDGKPRFVWAGANKGELLKIYDSYGCRVRGIGFFTTNGITVDKFIDIDRVAGFSSNHFIEDVELNAGNQNNPNFKAISIDESGGVNNENMHIENVRIYGSSQYARLTADDGSMTVGSPVLTSAVTFPTDAVGKTVRVSRAGAGGATLVTTCISRDTANQLTLADNAVATVTQARIHIGNPSGTGIYNGPNANAKHQILRHIQIAYCNIGVDNTVGSVEIFDYGAGFCATGFRNNGNTEPVIVEQMVTEGNLVEIDQPSSSGKLHIMDCRGSNTWQLADGFYKLSGRVFWESSHTEVPPPRGGRTIQSHGSGTLSLTMMEVKFAVGYSEPISLTASGFNTLTGSETIKTFGDTNVAGWPKTTSIRGGEKYASESYSVVASTNHNLAMAGTVADPALFDPNFRLEEVTGRNTRKWGDGEIEIFGCPRPNSPSIERVGPHQGGSASYTFSIVAVDANGNRSLRSANASVGTVATTLSSTDYLHLEWPATPNAATYELYRADPANAQGQAQLVASGITTNAYDITSNPATGPYSAYASLLPGWNQTTGIKFRARTVNVNESAFAAGATAPSVAVGNDFVTANTGATSITNFTNGVDGQTIRIRIADPNTTIVNNSTIVTSSGLDVSAMNGRIYTFILRGGAWRQL